MEDAPPTITLVLQNCTIAMNPKFPFNTTVDTVCLGRPWKMYSRTIILESFIHPEGWIQWMDNFGLRTSYSAEYKNMGLWSIKTGRATWPGIKCSITDRHVMLFTAGKSIMSGEWLTHFRVPYITGMMRVASSLE